MTRKIIQTEKPKKYTYTIGEMIEEVKNQTEFGKDIVRMQISYLRSLGYPRTGWVSRKKERKSMGKNERITQEMIDLIVARLETSPQNLLFGILGCS